MLPELRQVATVKHTHRINVEMMLPQIVSVGTIKSRHRMLVNHIVHNHEIGDMLRVFHRRHTVRMFFRETVLPQMHGRVYQRHLLTQRLHYASVWEKILYDIRTFNNKKTPTYTPLASSLYTKVLFDVYIMFFLALFCGAYIVLSLASVVVKTMWSVVYTTIDRQLSVLEQMYIKNQPRSCRRARRLKDKHNKKMKKIRYV
jgi:hypothetical protein